MAGEVDLTELSIAIDSGPVVQGTAALQQFATAGQQAAAGISQFTQAANQAGTTVAGIGQQTALAMQRVQAFAQATNNWQPSPGFAALNQNLQNTIGLAPQAANAHNQLGAAAQRAGQGAGLAAHQWGNLAFQLNDVAATLAQGMNPLQVLVQQGPQIYQALSSAPGGAAAGLREVATTAARIAGPVGAVVAGVTAIGGAAAMLVDNWRDADATITLSLNGIGARAGVSADAVRNLVDQVARADNISRGDARASVTSLIAGGVRGSNLVAAGSQVRNLQATLGLEKEADAAKLMAQALADPIRGAEMLSQRLGTINDATVQRIRLLMQENNLAEAQRVLVQALTGSLVDADEHMSIFARAWQGLWKDTAREFEFMNDFIRGVFNPTLEQSLARARQMVEILKNDPSATEGERSSLNFYENRVRDLERQLADRAREATDRAAESERTLAGNRASAMARGSNSDLRQRELLEERQRTLQGGISSGTLTPDNLAMVQTQLNRVTEALRSLRTEEESLIESHQLELDALRALGPEQQADIARRRERARLAGQEVGFRTAREEQAAVLERARLDKDWADSLRDRNQQLQQGADALRMEGQLMGASAADVAALRFQYEQLVEVYRRAQETGRPVTAEMRAEIERMGQQRGQQTQANAANRLTADLSFERDQMMRSPTEQRVYSTLRSARIDINDAHGEAIANQIRLNERMQETRDLAADTFKGMASDIRSGADALTIMDNALNRVLDTVLNKIMDNAANGLTAAIFGGPTGGTTTGTNGLNFQGMAASVAGMFRPSASGGIVTSAGEGFAQAPIIPVITQPLGAVAPSGGSSIGIQSIMGAIRAIESGGGNPAGNYSARGPLVKTGMYAGERAAGAYQIMPGNLPQWSRDALGRQVGLDEFMGDRGIQDTIAEHRMSLMYRQTGSAQDVASMWHSGRTLASATKAGVGDVNMKTTEYVQRFNREMQEGADQVGRSLEVSAQKIGESGQGVSTALSKVASAAGGAGGGGFDSFFRNLFNQGGGHSASSWGGISLESVSTPNLGFATGGAFRVGGTGGTDSQRVSFKASPDETVAIFRPEQLLGKGNGGNTYVNVNSPGAPVKTRESQDSRGNRRVDIDVLTEAVEGRLASRVRQGGTPLNTGLESRYGMNPAAGNN